VSAVTIVDEPGNCRGEQAAALEKGM